jgi:hypothetical protein
VSLESPYQRLEPVLCLIDVTDEPRVLIAAPAILEEVVSPTTERNEPAWSPAAAVATARELPADHVAMPRDSWQSQARSYRLFDWLTAIGFLVASLAIAFALNRNWFEAPFWHAEGLANPVSEHRTHE